MNQELSPKEGKKQYEPPQLATISLRPEEAVLGHCKILGQSSHVASICGFTCSNAGS
ncbi:MAG TPA: hypothetical protein VGS27_25235 [Candidatus Sulfotelmatobacter sp.]|nr:hypothetical protein [Candidatus Sulfotelmatobacter sp.]